VSDNREEVTGDWRRLENEELNYLCCTFYIIHMTKSRRMSLVEHVAHTEEKRSAYRLLVGYLKTVNYLKHLHADVTMYYNCLISSEMCSVQFVFFFLCTKEQTISRQFARPLSGNIYRAG
jgi:hypothetical protein